MKLPNLVAAVAVVSLSSAALANVTYRFPSMFRMPNGAYPCGMLASLNAPFSVTRVNVLSKTSILPLWKSVAYRKFPCPFCASARPL